MATQLHTQLLAEAATKHLKPLGLKQKGRSRTWLDDRGWFVAVVEFQPSGFSKGSYLNVGAHLLWHWSRHLSFDLGDRVQEFEPFDSEVQFEAVADRFAARAVVEVKALRARLARPGSVAEVISLPNRGRGWPHYHRAVSLALSGRQTAAIREFELLAAENGDNRPWVLELRRRCQSYARLTPDSEGFRAAITRLIGEQRMALKLPAIADPLSG